MYCEKCGQEIPDHATFCGKCGAKVRNASSERTITEQTKKTSKEQRVDGKALLLLLTGFCLLIAIVMGCCSIAHRNKTRIVSMGEEKVENTEISNSVEQENNLMSKEMGEEKVENTEISDSVEQKNNLMSKEVVGSTVIFGSYEQDNNLENGPEPIEWIVLDQKEDRVLLLSRYVIDCKRYHGVHTNITWENCDLRDWLNHEFFWTAFSEKQQEQIMETEVKNSDNINYGTRGGNDTYDRVFLLSLEEVGKYTGSDQEREATATKYAQEQGVWSDEEDETAPWWLRSPGDDIYSAACVELNYFGVNGFGYGARYVDRDNFGVRPALWMKLD